MIKKQIIQKDYSKYPRNYQLNISSEPEVLIPCDESVQLLSEVYEHLFVDGTKIEANANKYTFVWKKSVGKHQARLEEKLSGKLSELCSRYGWLGEVTPDEAMRRLSALQTEPFVYGYTV